MMQLQRGGAPRDWLNGHEARDIDLYLRSFCNTTTKRIGQLNKALGINVELLKNNSHEVIVDYGGLNVPIEAILSFKVEEVNFQLIYIKPSVEDFKSTIINHMDVGINRVAYDGYSPSFSASSYLKSKEYVEDKNNNTLSLYKDSMCPEQLSHCLTHHLPKMLSYFPEHKLVIL